MIIRKATNDDIPYIADLINNQGKNDYVLPRTHEELLRVIEGFWVSEVEGKVAGCVSLVMVDDGLAEIRSLVVDQGMQGHGIGKALVKACLDAAEETELPCVFALTAKPLFFEKLGFNQVPRSTFPQKFWMDCYKCRFIDACGEVAVQYILHTAPEVRPDAGAIVTGKRFI